MKNFKEFYYNLLRESPINISDWTDDDYYSNTREAMDIYSKVVNDTEYKKVFELTQLIHLYESEIDDEVICYFVPTNNNFIYGYVCYDKLPDGGIITTSVYNDKKMHGLAYRVYNEYLLKNFKYVMSDGRHTPKGKTFWSRMVSDNLHKNDTFCSVYDTLTNKTMVEIKNISDLNLYYGDAIDFERFRIKIENI